MGLSWHTEEAGMSECGQSWDNSGNTAEQYPIFDELLYWTFSLQIFNCKRKYVM